jgi:hypothetical protein
MAMLTAVMPMTPPTSGSASRAIRRPSSAEAALATTPIAAMTRPRTAVEQSSSGPKYSAAPQNYLRERRRLDAAQSGHGNEDWSGRQSEAHCDGREMDESGKLRALGNRVQEHAKQSNA